VGRAGGQVSPSKYLPDVPRAVHADGGRENGDNGHIYVVHGGSDFDQIDPSYSGRGEPGGIRPLGNGLYGYVIDHADSELAARSIDGAKRYSQKYGGGKKSLHVYKIPKSSSTVFNGDREVNVDGYPKPIKGLAEEPEVELNAYLAHTNTPKPPYNAQNSEAFWAHSDKRDSLWSAVKNAADLRMEHLPMGITEVSVQNPKVATRIGKFSLDTPSSDILDAVKGDVRDGNTTKADGGPAMFQGIHPDLQGESGAPLDLYHGTAHPEEFEAFDDAKLGARDAGFYGRGHYLSPDKGNAEEYGEDGTVIGPLHAALKNPYVWDVSDDMKSSKTLRDLQSMGIMRDKDELRSWDNLQQHHVRPFMAEMQKRGHDGVIVKTGHEHLPNGIAEVVAFDPKTIKHKEAEVFDPTDPRIRREAGGEVEKKRDFSRDNPGGEWLDRKQERAAQYPDRKFVVGSTTGVIGGRSSMFLPTHVLKGIAGLNDEVRTAGVSKYDSLLSDAREGGFDPEQKGNKVVVAVNHFGQPYLLEGNTRVAVAHSMGVPKVKAEVRYWNGAENVDGPMHPEKVFGMASDSPDVAKADGGEVDGDDDGITAYHSSPHDFDNFDIAHMGTGEGNQAYGHGLYFAENPKVSDRGGQYWNQFMNRGKQTPERQAAFALKVAGWDRDKAALGLQKNLEYHADRAIPGKYADGPELEEGHRLLAQETQEAIDHIRSGKILGPRTYKVKLNAGPHELLDWDKPLSEQHPQLQEKMRAILKPVNDDDWKNWTEGTGQRIHRTMGYPEDVAKELYAGGIKGIRYRDAGSRDQSDGDLTHNYVMFHHDPVKILEKYEYGGTVAKATGGPVMGYVPMASLTVPRLAVARAPQYQQQQGGVGKFSESLNSLMDTVEGFKKKPEANAERPVSAPSPSAASEGRTQLGMIAMPENGYEATGMYAPFQSAIDRMIADAPGKITVASGYRTPERQEELWNEHAAKYPDPEVRDDYVARAGQSSHNYGLAADLSYADQEAIKWAQENAAKYGLNFRMGHENWHIEPSNIWELRNAMTVPGYANGGSAMNEDNQNGAMENGNAPINSATRTQAGELPNAGGIRGGAGLLQTQNEAPLEGLPTKVGIPLSGQSVTAGPDPRIRGVARDYMASTGMKYNPPTKYAKADPSRARRIAAAYDAMKDDPNEPLTKASYDAMIKETMAQYEHAKKAGLKVEFWNPEKQKDPYGASPRLATEDVRNNHHMWVFPTYAGYGSGDPISEDDVKRNPLLQLTGETWNGIPVTVNDVFRAVHDYYGHAKEGVGFRADGEENAWRSHASMYSPLARMAMTSETRGQNSWLNYGPHGEKNRNARTEDTIFADQKIGVLPHWAHHEGAEDFTLPEDVEAMQRIRSNFDPVVSKALSLTRGFTKDGKSVINALKPKGK
jgi:hypothetical protein